MFFSWSANNPDIFRFFVKLGKTGPLDTSWKNNHNFPRKFGFYRRKFGNVWRLIRRSSLARQSCSSRWRGANDRLSIFPPFEAMVKNRLLRSSLRTPCSLILFHRFKWQINRCIEKHATPLVLVHHFNLTVNNLINPNNSLSLGCLGFFTVHTHTLWLVSPRATVFALRTRFQTLRDPQRLSCTRRWKCPFTSLTQVFGYWNRVLR